jgi:hypothetical protein
MHCHAPRVALLVLVSFLVPRLTAGALSWEKDKISEEIMGVEQSEVKTSFSFINKGDYPVTITGVEADCDCTAAGLSKKTYAPGERGKIAVVFHAGDQTGMQRKTITVTTDEPKEAPKQLLLYVNIKEYLTVEPHLLLWKVGEKRVEKGIFLSAIPSQPITQIEAKAEYAGAFQVRVETIEKGQKYAVYIKPISTANQVNTTITLNAKFTSIADRTIPAYAFVSSAGSD